MAAQSTPVEYADIPHDCIRCDSRICGKSNPRLKCTRCKGVYYCSKDCQKQDWKDHKKKCLPLEKSIEVIRKGDGFFSGKLHYTDEDVAFATGEVPKITECSICMKNPIVAPVLVKGCCHAFCSLCLRNWQNQQNENAPSGPNTIMVGDRLGGMRRLHAGQPPNHCPNCRGEAGPNNVINILVANAQQKLEKARNGGDQETRELLQELTKIDQVLAAENDENGADYTVYATKVQILLFLKRPQEALDCLAKFDQVQTNGKDWRDTTPEGLGLNLLEGEAYMQLGDWKTALERCGDAKVPMLIDFSVMRQMHMSRAKCYFYLGEYDRAIQTLSLETPPLCMPDHTNLQHRNYPGIRKYKALSQKQKGDIDAALFTMNQAVLYETPWEGAFGNVGETALDLYNMLLAEKSEG